MHPSGYCSGMLQLVGKSAAAGPYQAAVRQEAAMTPFKRYRPPAHDEQGRMKRMGVADQHFVPTAVSFCA